MATDTTEIASDLVPVRQAVANKHRLGFPHVLAAPASGVSRMAQELGTSRQAADRGLDMLRTVQEVPSDVAKRPGVSPVEARLTRRGRALPLLFEDGGCGFGAEHRRGPCALGLGLFGMEERPALIGDALPIESTLGRGTRVSAEVRLPRSIGR